MKVALVVYDLSVRGGTQKQVLRLAEDLRRRDASVQILAFDYSSQQGYSEFGQFAVQTLTERSGKGRLARAVGALFDAWRVVSRIESDTDILNVHDLMCEWVLLLSKLRRPRMKLVWQINDLHPAFRVGPFRDLKPRWSHPAYRTLGRLAAKVTDEVTVNVMKNKKRVDECYRVESLLFYPGVDQMEMKPLTRRYKTPLALLSIGVFFPYRNYEALIRAMAYLREHTVDSRLTLVGATRHSEAYVDKIRRLAEELDVPVHITGEVDADEFKQIVMDADVFLFPNLDQSWGLAVFEAMSSSLPAIISKSAGAAELLAGRPGCVVVDAESPTEIASAVTDFTKTQEGYDKSCRDAFATVSAMSWPAMYCREMWDLFQELILA